MVKADGVNALVTALSSNDRPPLRCSVAACLLSSPTCESGFIVNEQLERVLVRVLALDSSPDVRSQCAETLDVVFSQNPKAWGTCSVPPTTRKQTAQAKAAQERIASQGPSPTYQTNQTAQRMPAAGQRTHNDYEKELPQNADKLYDVDVQEAKTGAFALRHLVFQDKEKVDIEGKEVELYPGYPKDLGDLGDQYQTFASCALCAKVKQYLKPEADKSEGFTLPVRLKKSSLPYRRQSGMKPTWNVNSLLPTAKYPHYKCVWVATLRR